MHPKYNTKNKLLGCLAWIENLSCVLVNFFSQLANVAFMIWNSWRCCDVETNVGYYFLNEIVIVLEDYFLFNLNKCQKSAQPRVRKEAKNEREKTQINNDCCRGVKRNNGSRKCKKKRAMEKKKLYCFLAAVWSLHYEGSLTYNLTEKKKKVPTRFTSIAFHAGGELVVIRQRRKEEGEKACYTVCDLNEWHLFIPCHWLISHCFCFIIKIFTLVLFTISIWL